MQNAFPLINHTQKKIGIVSQISSKKEMIWIEISFVELIVQEPENYKKIPKSTESDYTETGILDPSVR